MICIWSSWCYCHFVISCFIKIHICLTGLLPAYPGCPGIEAVKRLSVYYCCYSMPGPVSTGMSGRLQAGKPPRFVFNQPLRPTQPSTLIGAENEYRPKCGDALRLGNKGKYGSFHSWINV